MTRPTSTPTGRYHGRCLTRGCRYHATITADTHDTLRATTDYSGNPTLTLLIDGEPYPLQYSPWQQTAAAQLAAHRAAGLCCPRHNRPLKWQRGVATVVPGTSCSGSCTHASGNECVCECGGTNHGSASLLLPTLC